MKYKKSLLLLLVIALITLCNLVPVFASETEESDEIIDIVINLSDVVNESSIEQGAGISAYSSVVESDGKLTLRSPHDDSVATVITFHFCYEYTDGVDVYLISVTNDRINGYNNHLTQWDGSGQIYNYGNMGSYQRLFNIYNQVTGERMRYRFIFNCDLYGQEFCTADFTGVLN